jgi:pimeloyl-ACP methyl ester carboxylesterase
MLASIRLFFTLITWLSPTLAGRLAAWLFSRPQRHRRPERERALVARGEPLALRNGLRATAWGAGRLVLLVHGWEGRGAQLGAFVEPLVNAGYRVVALDGPAHGDSPGRTTTGPDFARALISVRDELGPIHIVVAHSFGGFTSLLAVSRGWKIERLVTISAPSSVPEILDDFARTIALSPRALPAMVNALEHRVGATMASFDVESFASAITVPVLIIHDTDDREVAYKHAERLAQLLGARLMTTSGLGHRRILFAPEIVTAVVNFAEADQRRARETEPALEQK